jgi:major membrane immunogen (membrane-anchored lipoprotein)
LIARRLIIACVLAVGLVACSQSHANDPTALATSAAQALYNNDYSGATANFDDALKGQATRTQVAVISDKMHSLGDFQGLTLSKSDEDTRRYWFDAKFSKGAMTVEMKLHANGQIAAYRIVPAS